MSTKITVKANVKLPVARVWEYYNKPEHIVNWNFASPDWHCPSCENDLRVGGKIKSRMEAKDGSSGFDFIGLYKDIKEAALIHYVMEDGRECSTTFSETNGTTEIITIFDAEGTNPIEMQRDGWQAILNNFKQYAESQAQVG